MCAKNVIGADDLVFNEEVLEDVWVRPPVPDDTEP